MSVQTPVHTKDWKVPVGTADVVLRLEGGETRNARVYLQVATPSRRPQSVLDLLNERVHFLAMEERGRTCLIHKDALFWVDGGDQILPPEGDVPPLRRSVRLWMAGGIEMRGETLIVAPPGHRRVLDLLNGPESFITLMVGGRPRIIHKRHIHRIEPVEG